MSTKERKWNQSIKGAFLFETLFTSRCWKQSIVERHKLLQCILDQICILIFLLSYMKVRNWIEKFTNDNQDSL